MSNSGLLQVSGLRFLWQKVLLLFCSSFQKVYFRSIINYQCQYQCLSWLDYDLQPVSSTKLLTHCFKRQEVSYCNGWHEANALLVEWQAARAFDPFGFEIGLSPHLQPNVVFAVTVVFLISMTFSEHDFADRCRGVCNGIYIYFWLCLYVIQHFINRSVKCCRPFWTRLFQSLI